MFVHMHMCVPAFAIQQSCLIQMLLCPENARITALLWEAFVSHQDGAFYCLCLSKQPKGTEMSKKHAKGLAAADSPMKAAFHFWNVFYDRVPSQLLGHL